MIEKFTEPERDDPMNFIPSNRMRSLAVMVAAIIISVALTESYVHFFYITLILFSIQKKRPFLFLFNIYLL